MGEMTLEQVELEIYRFYQWFAVEAPGVTADWKSGYLGDLWALFYRLLGQES